jgi:hypothetical protein
MILKSYENSLHTSHKNLEFECVGFTVSHISFIFFLIMGRVSTQNVGCFKTNYKVYI